MIGPYTFLHAALAGFFAFAALYHFVLWRASRRETTLLIFAIHTAICMVGSIVTVKLIAADSIAEAQWAWSWRSTYLALAMISLTWLLVYVSQLDARPIAWGATVVFGALAVASRVMPFGGVVDQISRGSTPWGEAVTLVHHTAQSRWVGPIYLLFALVHVFGMYCAWRMRTRDAVGALLVGLATAPPVIMVVLAMAGVLFAGPSWFYIGTMSSAALVVLIAMQLAHQQRRADEGRRRLQVQLQRAQRLEAVGQLAGGVAHDFNNLLTIINGFSEILLSGKPRPDQHAELLEIRDAGGRAASLTQQLVAFTGRSILEVSTIDANMLFAQAERMLRRALGAGIELIVSRSPTPAWVRVDVGQLERVLVNLVFNSRDAMPSGGQVRLSLRVLPDGHGLPRATTAVVLSIADTGTGMTPDVKARLFEPFFTTKGPGRGTGLGLAVVDGFVRQHGGRVEVNSEVGRGTTFEITLPGAAPVEPARAAGDVEPRAEGGTETVLVIDDDAAVLQLVRTTLTQHGYTVLVASSGDIAMRLLDEHDRPPDLLLTDVVLHGIGGGAIAETMRQRVPQLRVLFMSGYTEDEALRHGVEAGETRMLNKPFRLSTLLAKVRETLDAPVHDATVSPSARG